MKRLNQLRQKVLSEYEPLEFGKIVLDQPHSISEILSVVSQLQTEKIETLDMRNACLSIDIPTTDEEYRFYNV